MVYNPANIAEARLGYGPEKLAAITGQQKPPRRPRYTMTAKVCLGHGPIPIQLGSGRTRYSDGDETSAMGAQLWDGNPVTSHRSSRRRAIAWTRHLLPISLDARVQLRLVRETYRSHGMPSSLIHVPVSDQLGRHKSELAGESTDPLKPRMPASYAGHPRRPSLPMHVADFPIQLGSSRTRVFRRR